METRTMLKTRVKNVNTESLIDALYLLGGGILPIDKAIMRAYLLDEYEARLGEDAVERLMAEIGT